MLIRYLTLDRKFAVLIIKPDEKDNTSFVNCGNN